MNQTLDCARPAEMGVASLWNLQSLPLLTATSPHYSTTAHKLEGRAVTRSPSQSHFSFLLGRRHSYHSCQSPSSFVVCQAKEREKADAARQKQMHATDLLAQLLKAEDVEAYARENVEFFTQDFFTIGSAYLTMAKKEGNAEVVNRLEYTLKIAMMEREKTLRPEIQLLNQLLRDNGVSERAKTMDKFVDYLKSDSYFFQLLNRMTMDVERQPGSPLNSDKVKLLSQLRAINKEAKDVSKRLKSLATD